MLMQKLGNKGPVIKISLYLFICLSNFVFSQTSGIASKYIGDKGIETDPDVIFAENFEEGSINAVASRWTSVRNAAGMSLVSDVPPQSSGKSSLLITSISDVNTGGDLRKTFPDGYEKVYLRNYIKYAKDTLYHHSNIRIRGGEVDAGVKPTNGFSVGAESVAFTPRYDFYVYWMHMRGAPGSYYGNTFIQDPNVKQVPDKWMCVEVMVKMNTPVTSYNGELAMWIDGNLIIHLGEGFPKGWWKEPTHFYPDETNPDIAIDPCE